MSEMNKQMNLAPHKLMMLITIVKKGKGTFFADFLKTFDANLQVCVVGNGSSEETELAEYLGLKESRRTVIFSIVREESVKAILEALEDRFHTVNEDWGISFAMPLSSVIGKLSYGFLSNDQRMVSKDE